METKEEILKNIKDNIEIKEDNKQKNIINIFESSYNEYYLIGECFTLEELFAMSEEELNNLMRLAEYACDTFL